MLYILESDMWNWIHLDMYIFGSIQFRRSTAVGANQKNGSVIALSQQKNTLGYASIIIMNEHACQMLGYASIIIMNEHACQMYRSGRQSFWIPMLLCLAYPPGLRRVRKTSRSVARSYGRISWSIGISPPTTELIAPNAKATYTDTFPPWSLRTPHNGTVARHGCMQLRLPCQTLFDTKGRREAHPVQTTHTIHYRLCT